VINKRLSFYLVVVLIITGFIMPVSAQTEFSDLNSEHWAFSSVMMLVESGTVNGFEDGEFKPDKTVSRAEFVKMIGKTEQKRQGDFLDINPSHWAYDYIMYSQLEGKDNVFSPDTAITRDDCLNLIWNRNQAPKDVIAPSVITNQSSNKDAAAWGYAYGIMIGDDGLNLRLGDSLTRAEASVLITRAQTLDSNAQKNNFIDTVSDKILETVFKSMNLLLQKEYSKDQTFTNGEMARAALILALDSSNITYKPVPEAFSNHKYGKDFYTVFIECIADNNLDEQLIDQPATIQDTLVAMIYNAIKRSSTPVKYGSIGKHYNDIGALGNPMADLCITFGYENGIRLTADNNINSTKQITHKEFACILLQLDSLIGLKSEYITDSKNGVGASKNAKINKNLTAYPANATDYPYILEGLPKEVYQTPFAQNIGASPNAVFDFTNEYRIIFINMLNELKTKIENETKAVVDFTFFPSLVCQNNNGATLRVKCEVKSNNENALLTNIFNNENLPAEAATKGLTFYADILTGQSINDVYLIADKVSAEQIVYTKTSN